jgi:hypothetical protein
MDRPAGFFPGGFAQGGPCATDQSTSSIGAFWPIALKAFPRCSLYAKPRIFCAFVEAHEPMRNQRFSPELAVERLDDGLVGWFAGPGEVKGGVTLECSLLSPARTMAHRAKVVRPRPQAENVPTSRCLWGDQPDAHLFALVRES